MSKISNEWKLSAVHQRFSLPENLVFYVVKNPPSPEVYNKLIKFCKYFSLKNPIITLYRLNFLNDVKYWKTKKINVFQKRKKFKIENLNKKLWIYQKLIVIEHRNQFLASSLIPRIYRCDLIRLELSNQTLTFAEFRKLTSSGSLKKLDLARVLVKSDDGTIIPIEKLIESLPKLRTCYYGNVLGEEGLQTITFETAANLIAIPHFPKMKEFHIYGIPESFDFEAFFATPKVRALMLNELND